ncbi:hypothetical protein J437_LFUL014237 [Ladona fulva]|uniref:Uncharacterized protein n=1 Tax=Ladona fulva TaxID=123851 RepID=A0A8K0P7U6_LADFU|nr:hypothetical protein J437_LFUL014237 [Ladona fulva]
MCIAVGGRAANRKHLSTNNHKQSLDASASYSKATNKNQLSAMDGTFAFHTIIHNHSFRSMDCTPKY